MWGNCSHLFQRVASFLLCFSQRTAKSSSGTFSSLSESGFIPTQNSWSPSPGLSFSFSSLSESGFIPTNNSADWVIGPKGKVLISFREWLHSYPKISRQSYKQSHSKFSSLSESGFIPTVSASIDFKILRIFVLISFREWLHSYTEELLKKYGWKVTVLISFREWLHSYLLFWSL